MNVVNISRVNIDRDRQLWLRVLQDIHGAPCLDIRIATPLAATMSVWSPTAEGIILSPHEARHVARALPGALAVLEAKVNEPKY
jgi:hypothetical protein